MANTETSVQNGSQRKHPQRVLLLKEEHPLPRAAKVSVLPPVPLHPPTTGTPALSCHLDPENSVVNRDKRVSCLLPAQAKPPQLCYQPHWLWEARTVSRISVWTPKPSKRVLSYTSMSWNIVFRQLIFSYTMPISTFKYWPDSCFLDLGKLVSFNGKK